MGSCRVTQGAQPCICEDLEGWGWGEEAQEEGDFICIIMVDLFCLRAETNTTLLSNYPTIKKILIVQI